MSSMMRALLAVLALSPLIGCGTPAKAGARRSTAVAASGAIHATAAGVAEDGRVWATIAGDKRVVGEGGLKAWVLADGRYVAYSAADGAGGYENEGQSLYLYDADSGATRKVMAVYFVIDEMTSATLSNRQIALLAKMSDGGLGADHLAIVDPARGIVFQQTSARATAVRGDELTVTAFNFEEDAQQPVPTGVATYDLKELLRRDVIVNARSPL